jgi:hypothetical protein
MRLSLLSVTILLGVLTAATVFAWAATARYTPPAETGNIYTVIDYARAHGRAQATLVSVSWGAVQRDLVVAAPYQTCAQSTPAGFVFRLRHPRPDSTPLTLTTNGNIVRGPYQGPLPLELLHPCYRLLN